MPGPEKPKSYKIETPIYISDDPDFELAITLSKSMIEEKPKPTLSNKQISKKLKLVCRDSSQLNISKDKKADILLARLTTIMSIKMKSFIYAGRVKSLSQLWQSSYFTSQEQLRTESTTTLQDSALGDQEIQPISFTKELIDLSNLVGSNLVSDCFLLAQDGIPVPAHRFIFAAWEFGFIPVFM
ncbi:hypothetical protein Ciccas_004831 [Cichlidogyrus casuarinus]|uniref:BTB domain-containing protein n=1 Tax=Cichlidogyrus casuarinus TaxID=1844966 RepID=A0ABD2QAD2_9PLAT